MPRPKQPEQTAARNPTGLLPPLTSAVTPEGTASGPVARRRNSSEEDAPTLDFQTGLASTDASLSASLGTRPGATLGEPGPSLSPEDIRTDPWSLSQDRVGDPSVEDGGLVGGCYRILGVLGKGGMAWTYRVRHETLGKEFALKVLREGAASDPRLRDFFYQEAQLAGQLEHPNIVSVTDFGTDAEHGTYLVMDQLKGETLLRRMDGRLPLRLTLAMDFTLQLAEALQYMHEHSIVHRDVKPDNVFVCRASREQRRRPQLKLIDFGLARREAMGALLSRSELLGTPGYMAPEQLHRAPPQPTMDIYALASMFYEMVTGRLPFTGTVEEIVEAKKTLDPEPPSNHGMDPPSERLDTLLCKALSREPTARHPTMSHFLFELRTVRDMLAPERPVVAQGSAELALAASSAVQQGWMTFDTCPFPQFSMHGDGYLLSANQAFGWFLGVPAARLVGRSVNDTRLGQIYPKIREDMAKAVLGAEPVQRRIRLELKDGARSQLILWLMPLFDELGGFVSCTGIVIPENSLP